MGQRDWLSLCRRHFPREGDEDGVLLADVLKLQNGVTHSASILSAGVDAAIPAALHYEPQGSTLLSISTRSTRDCSRTWSPNLSNYPYMHFCHQLDPALLGERITEMEPKVLDDIRAIELRSQASQGRTKRR